MPDTTFRTVLPALKAVDNGDGTYSVAVVIQGIPPLTGLTAGELLVATAATTAAWQSTGVVLSAPDISGVVTAAAALTLPAFTLGGAIAGGDQTWTNVGDMTFHAASIIKSGSTNTDTLLLAANDTTFITFTTAVTDVCTLTAVTMSGTWLASGIVTLPAFTLGGDISGNSRNILGLAAITGRSTDNFSIETSAAAHALYINIKRTAANTGVGYYLRTYNASDVATSRMTVTSGVDVAIVNWFSTTHINLILSGALDAAANYISFTEMAAPGAGAVNTARIYAIVDGGGLTDLAAVFQDGSVDIFAQEVTEPDSPVFTFPDATDLKLQLRKPDRKTVQFVAIFPDDREFVMREIRYPSPRWN